MTFVDGFRAALGGLDVAHLPPETLTKLTLLDDLLRHWSKRVDLVGFKSDEERIRRYFAEPLAASSWLRLEGSALDIGSGGGSPGLPFAIVSPKLRWTLMEPRRKKSLFLEEVIRELGLRNVSVVGRRFEAKAEERDLATITVRGVRLERPLQSAVVRSLGCAGRFLWFSSEDRLLEGARAFGDRKELRRDGPHRLLPSGGSFLLVLEKLPGGRFT